MTCIFIILHRTKSEEFIPNDPKLVKMYTCGPTVYHFAHIGNLRSYIMEDVLEKYLRYIGYPVKRVMNITDVGHLTSDADEGEDKMLKGARREHKSVMEIAKFYTDAFFDDCRKLNIKRPDVVQPATGCIDEYIKIITKLLDTGYAYQAGGNVYFDTSKLEKYYIFNDHNEEDLAVGVREGVEEDTNKRNKNDFVLWFTKSKFEDQALKWDSPWVCGLSRLAHRVLRHFAQVPRRRPRYPLRAALTTPSRTTRTEIAQSGELHRPPLVQLLDARDAPEHHVRQDVEVQRRVFDGFSSRAEGL